MTLVDPGTIAQSLDRLFPDPPPDAWLVVSRTDPSGAFPSVWFRAAEVPAAARWLAEHAADHNVYVAMGLHDPAHTPPPASRGSRETVCAIPGLWVELDHNQGAHAAAPRLPSPDTLVDFLARVPVPPSLLVDSGGGLHAYWLFRECWCFDTREEQHRAAALLHRFQRTLQVRAAEEGWSIDSTYDLARVLRPVGTLNHKTLPPRPVTLLHEVAARYNPSDLWEAPWLVAIEDTDTAAPPGRDGRPAPLAPLVDGCGWVRHCRDDAAHLEEPAWYAMLGIVGRTQDGDETAHAWSAPYPRYTPAETAAKLAHALAAAGPATCTRIRWDLGGDPYCRACPHLGTVKSPLALGRRRHFLVGQAATTSPAPATPRGQAAVAAFLARLGALPDADKAAALYADLDLLAALPTRTWHELKPTLSWQIPGLDLAALEQARLAARTRQQATRASTGQGPPPAGGTPAGSPGQPPPIDPDDLMTDHYNALAMVHDHGTKLKYCTPWKCWLIWKDTHWQRDTAGEVLGLAIQSVKGLATRLASLDKDEARALLKHITASLSTSRLKAMLEQTQVGQGIPVQPDQLDRHPWLLNVANGTLDLTTGELGPHDPAHLLTQCLAVAYDKDAQCSAWKAFLWRVLNHKQEVIDFLQRALGYALTGIIREHVLIILWGNGRNGKSTLLGTALSLFGPYGMKATSELLMVGAHDRHPTERAELFQKRFVAAIETEQGRRLAEVFVKEVTGGDRITARRMREDFWSFDPTHTVFLTTNHKPIIRGKDNAIWERLKLVEFGVTIPRTERDTKLAETLQGELPGILAWAVRGCLAWQQNGLGEPSTVTEATADYRTAMDALGAFIDARCLTGASYNSRSGTLYEAYTTWCAETKKAPATQQTWGADLIERGFARYTNNGTWYRGIALRDGTTGGSVDAGTSQSGSVDED